MQISTRKFSAMLISAATAVSTLTPAVAAPRPAFEMQPQTDVQDVRWVCDRYRNCWEVPDRRREPGFSIQIGPGGIDMGPDYDYGHHRSPPPRRYGGDSWGAHVNWCMHRYRSYDPRSDTFTTYSGHQRRCRSPYD